MLSLDANERQIVDAAAGFLEGIGGLARARRAHSRQTGFDRDSWRQMAELGWFGAGIPEARGGLGLSIRELVLLFEQCGTQLLPEPLVPTVAAATLLAACDTQDAAELLAQMIAGDAICIPVLPEPATSEADYSCFAHEGESADWFLLGVGEGAGFRLCAAQRGTPGLKLESAPTVDGGSMVWVRFAGLDPARTKIVGSGLAAAAAFAAAGDLIRLGYSALLVGLAKEALRMTVAHLKDRKQFGVAVGTFQALQHRCATMHVDIISSRAFLYEACEAFGTDRQALAASAIKVRASETAIKVVRESVQFHGAMGYTDEHNISLFFRRAMGLAAAAGDPVQCLKFVGPEAERLRMLEQA